MNPSRRPRSAGALPIIVGLLLSVAPALTLLATWIVDVVVRREPFGQGSARRFAVMALGAALIVVPQIAMGRPALEQFVPWGWIVAFPVGMRAARGGGALAAEVRSRVALGVAVGLVATLFIALAGVVSGAAGSWRWLGMHENLWAARLAVLALAIPLIAPGRPWAWSWLLAAAGGVAAGSRAVLIGVVLGAAVGGWARRLAPSLAIRRAVVWVGLAAVAIGLLPTVRQHLLDGVRGLLPPPPSVNLVPASEGVGSAPWLLEGVRTEVVGRDGDGYAITRVTKTDGALGSRPIAPLDLEAEQPYVLTAVLVPEQGTAPGIRIWAPASANAPSFVATFGLDAAPARIDGSGISYDQASLAETADGGWSLRVRLVVHGDLARRVWIGPAPDLRAGTVGGSVRVSRLQVTAEDLAVGVYVPTFAESESARTARSRLEIFSIARRGIAEAPWFGHGVASFEAYQRARRADAFAFGHAHNFVLHVLFETGAVGLTGLVLVVGAMAWPGRGRRLRPEVVTLVIAVVAMNTFDATFVAADVTMAFAAALGLALNSREAQSGSRGRVVACGTQLSSS